MQDHMSLCPYIAFEGPIAAGKTTLATLLALHISSDLVLEDFEGNEFLADFYSNRDRWSLPMQLWFLSARIPPLKSIQRTGERATIADYTSRKDPLFARLLLKDRELRLFNRVAAVAAGDVSQPDLIVYLDARTDILLERIRQRGRIYEDAIDGAYLDALRDAYDGDLMSTGRLNVFRYDTSTLDLNSEAQKRSLYETIMASVPTIDQNDVGQRRATVSI
ncbi:MAG TPA: deoxynucleoside kinase [Bryobacteraceae bacterium]|nr:deoxynucleoside kinase [Bryobacteraceae bacterium]